MTDLLLVPAAGGGRHQDPRAWEQPAAARPGRPDHHQGVPRHGAQGPPGTIIIIIILLTSLSSYHHDHDPAQSWRWDLVLSSLKWPGCALVRLEEAGARLYLRKLVQFFLPSSNMFSRLELDSAKVSSFIVALSPTQPPAPRRCRTAATWPGWASTCWTSCCSPRQLPTQLQLRPPSPSCPRRRSCWTSCSRTSSAAWRSCWRPAARTAACSGESGAARARHEALSI